MILSEQLKAGCEHSVNGRLNEAEALYQSVLKENPEDVDALVFLSVLYQQMGLAETSKSLVERLNSILIEKAQFYNNLGIMLQNQGLSHLAHHSYWMGLSYWPDYDVIHYNVGNIFKHQGRGKEAIGEYCRALELNPRFLEAYNNLGTVYLSLQQHEKAKQTFEKALQLKPDFLEGYNNLGNVYLGLKEWTLAEQTLQKALEIDPNSVEAYNNLANTQRYLGQPDNAIASYKKALEINPQSAEVWVNLGVALSQEAADPETAIGCFNKALELVPEYPEAFCYRGLAKLMLGQFSQGWQDYEWRMQIQEYPKRPIPGQLWEGEPLEGKTLLVTEEQGYGDILHFLRYVPLVKEQHQCKIVFLSKPALQPLLRLGKGWDKVITSLSPEIQYDYQIPLMSLPLVFQTEASTIPPAVDYIKRDRLKVSYWQKRIRKHSGLKVGLVWAGDPQHRNNHNRSMPLSTLAPLFRVLDTRFYSLQKGDSTQDTYEVSPTDHLTNLSAEIHDFTDTVAIIENLDLVISVDTSVAHLAATMGKPTWVLVPYSPDWRWLMTGDKSDWYPTATLFRQTRHGDWHEVIERVSEALRKLASK